MRIVIASRKSDLARIQAYHIADLIREKDSSIEIEHNFSASFGDKNLDISLFKMPEKGSFTQDFREGLESGEFDLVVHSWKDLPTDISPTSNIHTVGREDARDVLLIKKNRLSKIIAEQNLEILTSSPRRVYSLDLNLKSLLPGDIETLDFKEVRGNIPTRLKKLVEGDSDALVIAKAALDRMLDPPKSREEFILVAKETEKYLQDCHWVVLPLSLFPTAAAQGALAIESHKENSKIKSILDSIHRSDVFENVREERRILRSYGGGCHQKIGINISEYDFGKVKSLMGKTSEDVILKDYSLINIKEKDLPPSSLYWPKRGEEKNFFNRAEITEELSGQNFWVSRENALPANWKQNNSLLWCAGVKTWKKLASRGHWINGCSDGLGENVKRRVDFLSGDINWVKLSHDRSPKGRFKVLATYSLENKVEAPNLSEYEEFFWMSSTQFLRAKELFPEIVDKKHFSGPGHTRDILEKHIQAENIYLELSYESWLKRREDN